MAFKTDRMSAQDRVLRNFGKTLKSGSNVENKPLSLAEQLKQLEQDEKSKIEQPVNSSRPKDDEIRYAGWCIQKS